jgi:purine-binding chemotaxis protein CheW
VEYGIDILRVQEIRAYEEPARIAGSPALPPALAPAFFKGVVNLRGVIVPIIDLRVKLSCERAEVNALTAVIVLNIMGRVVGAVVDSVSGVLDLPVAAVKPAPEVTPRVDTSFITGIAQVGERMVMLMDITALMGAADMGLIELAQAGLATPRSHRSTPCVH